MNSQSHREVGRAPREFLVGITVTALAMLIEWRFDLLDNLFAAMRRHYADVVDEALRMAAILGIAMVIFAWRQWRALLRQDQERARVERALRSSEEQYRALFEDVNDAMLIFTPVSEIILAANERAAELYGIPLTALIGRSLQQFSTDRDYGAQCVHDLLTHGDAAPRRTFSFVQQRPDGTRLDILAHASLITYEGETAVLTINRDVTEQKRAEDLLRRQNAYLTALHETSLGLMNRLDLTELLEAILVRAGALLGTPDGMIFWLQDGDPELSTRLGIGLFHDDPRPPLGRGEGLLGTVWETGERLILNDYQRWPKRRVGDKRNEIHAAVAVPMLADRQVIGVISLVHVQPGRVFSDDEVELLTRFAHLAAIALDNARLYTQMGEELREREQAEILLRESEERYRVMFESNPLPMWVYDRGTLAFLAVNDAAIAHYGYTHDEFLAMTIMDIRPPEEISQLLEDLLKEPRTLERGRFVRHRKKDGTIIDVEINSHDLHLDGRQTRLVLANDVTERTRAEEGLRESEERYRTLIERSPEPIVVHGKGRYVFANAAALRLLGAVTPEQVVGESVYTFVHPTFRDVARRRIRTSYRVRASSGVTELTMLRVDGEAIEVETDNMPIIYHGKPATLVIFHDITARKRAEQQLRESEERYRLMFESNPLPMWVYDDENLAFLAVNDAAVAHYGYSPSEFLTMSTLDIRPPEDIPALRAYLATYTNKYQPSGVWRHRKRDGTLVDMEIISYLLEFQGRPARLVVANDVTERQRAEEALRHHALHDALTTLPNRTLIAERLARALERSKRDPSYHYAVLYLDFDRFKTINDSLGHLEGDQVLIEGARRLMRCLRPQDTLARVGGDEFVLLLEELADRDTPVEVANCLTQVLAKPISLRGHDIVIAASIGIVFGTADYHRPDELLRDADIAMYQAKAAGKGEPIVFDVTMHARAVARLHLENDLRRALEQDEFTLFFQPIFMLTTGEVVGFEALARWQHPDIGLIAPGDFIPLAEETGLIVPLGQWVLREACQQLRRWDERYPAHAPVTMSVNISARELRQPDFVAYILSVVWEAGLRPQRLVLEITESTLIEETESVTETLRTLHRAGVRVQLDDFGMGYSSLSYLHHFPLDALKIDRSFVSAPGRTAVVNRGIVAAIVALAHTLQIAVTAEGIETAEQQAELEALACEYGQGYHFSPPMMAEDAAQFLQEVMRGKNGTSATMRANHIAEHGNPEFLPQ